MKRWNPREEGPFMDRARDGLYVDFQDHEVAVANARAEGDSLAEALQTSQEKLFATGNELNDFRSALSMCVGAVEEVGPWGENYEDTRICDYCGGAGPDGKPDEITHREDCPFGRGRALLAALKGTKND